MLKFYRLLAALCSPFLFVYSYIKARRYNDLNERLKNQRGYATSARPNGHLLWIHAASVGETLAALTLVNKIREIRQGRLDNVLITTTTNTAANLLRTRLAGDVELRSCCIHQYVPVDVFSWCERFIKYWSPHSALFLESELWPNLIEAAFKNGVKLGLVNARLSHTSVKRWTKFKNTLSGVLDRFLVIIAQSKSDQENISFFAKSPVACVGNLKHSADALPVNNDTLDKLKSIFAGRNVFIAASTHKGEEEIVIAAYKLIKKKHKLLTILAPRHPNRGQDIGIICQQEGIKYVRRSQVGNNIPEDTEMYIVDTIGELGTFYTLADIAFIGKSLLPGGGHNMLEPAKLNCSIMYGPYMDNFKDLDQLFQERGATVIVHEAKEIAESVCFQLEDRNKLLSLKKAAYNVAISQQNVATEVVKLLDKVLS